METSLGLGDRGVPIHAALMGLGISKDVIVCTPQEYETWSKWASSAIHRAAHEGRVLYEAA